MRKNTLIMRKTRWIMWKFKQFTTLIIIINYCAFPLFCCYVNSLVRILLLLLRLFEDKFIHTKPADDSLRSRTSDAFHKTSTRAHRQKMRGMPGGLKSLVKEAAEKNCFKIINLFGFYACEDGKQLIYH